MRINCRWCLNMIMWDVSERVWKRVVPITKEEWPTRSSEDRAQVCALSPTGLAHDPSEVKIDLRGAL